LRYSVILPALLALTGTAVVTTNAQVEEESCDFCCEGICNGYDNLGDGGRCMVSMPPVGGYCETTGDGQSITCRSYRADGSIFDSDTEFCGGFADCDWFDPFCFV